MSIIDRERNSPGFVHWLTPVQYESDIYLPLPVRELMLKTGGPPSPATMGKEISGRMKVLSRLNPT